MAIQNLLDYCDTHPDANLRYKARGMILKVHSDSSYLSESQARSRAGIFFYMGGATIDSSQKNGEIMVILTIISNAMSVDTTGFHRTDHAVETMGTISQAPSLPVKMYSDK